MPVDPIQPNNTPSSNPLSTKANAHDVRSVQQKINEQKFTLAIMQALIESHNASVEDQIERDIEYAQELELILDQHSKTKHIIELLISGKHNLKFEDINI